MVLFSCFMQVKKSLKKYYIVMTVFGITLLVNIIRIITEVFIKEYPFLRLPLNTLPMVITIVLIQFLFQGQWYKKVFTGILYFAIIMIAEFILMLMASIALGHTENGNYNYTMGLLSDITGLVVLGMVLSIKYGRRKKGMYMSWKLSVIQILIVLIFTFSGFMRMIGIHLSGVITAQDITFVFSLIILLVLFYMAFEISDSINHKNQEYRLQEQRHELLEEYYKRVESHQHEIRTIKHDLKNQLIMLSGYMEDSNQNKAVGQIDALVQKLSLSDTENFTTHLGINALLGAKYRLAQSEGIICEFTVKLPADIQIAENDLAIVIGNVLDNAIEACQHCSGRIYIQFKLVYYNNSLVLSCENSTNGQFNTLKSRKTDTINHGIGMGSIKRVVKQYSGSMHHQFDAHSFSLELTMFEKKHDEKRHSS